MARRVAGVIAMATAAVIISSGWAAEDNSPEALGRSLAAELRRQRPTENSTNSASLRLRDKSGRRSTIPVNIRTVLTDTGWEAHYTLPQSNTNGATTATIRHGDGKSPEYAVQAAGSDVASFGHADIPLGGSDFWVSDLALEFLHWPQQKVLRMEPSSGRMCHVLESINPGTNGYARVVSWIDTKYDALLNAEAYNKAGRLVKRFSTGSFKKVARPDGQEAWFLQDVKISDRTRDSVTELNFEVPESK